MNTGNTEENIIQPHSIINATHIYFRGGTKSHAEDAQEGADKVLHACPTDVEEWRYSNVNIYGSEWLRAGEDFHLTCVGWHTEWL